jgi:hypothetical protein
LAAVALLCTIVGQLAVVIERLDRQSEKIAEREAGQSSEQGTRG